jgi:hypothetical protein
MKKTILAFVLAGLSVSYVHAEKTANLMVKGTLTNDTACEPTLAGLSDFSGFHVDTLSSTETNQLGTKEILLTVQCSAKTLVGWNVTDDRHDSAVSDIDIKSGVAGGGTTTSSSQVFGLGKTTGGVNIGGYSIIAESTDATMDGKAAVLISSDNLDDEAGWKNSDATGGEISVLNQEAPRVISMGGESNLPTMYSDGTYPLKITAAIQDTTTLAITDKATLDGSATISIVYL